jgi:SepF-like predicted cell division protein (DUF552 family)
MLTVGRDWQEMRRKVLEGANNLRRNLKVRVLPLSPRTVIVTPMSLIHSV